MCVCVFGGGVKALQLVEMKSASLNFTDRFDED